ncbi:uncharacterized protein LOC110686903 [Chenopodium quinoa]|uniref:uncharacterized protein LOC110686903 n=1 Tax=Chenopodium quinoa TaxID=63459 RepID=UPI000B76ED5A|nr:uncharacterized protein LOC110686903 [Chenopodium quinoa]
MYCSVQEMEGTFFTFYRGLLLLGLYDGTYEVHNVATNQVYTVPKSPIVTRYGSKTDCSRAGAIIKLRSKNRVCRFLVVRFSLEYRKYEVYYSEDGTWVGFGLEGYNFNAAHKLLTDNYAVILMESNIYIYLLTNRNHGVRFAIFGPKTNHKITYHTFSLPKLLNRKHLSKKLWICDKTLHLSYYDIGTLCIWKAGEEIQRRGATSASWVWIRKLVITNTLELSILPFIKTNAQKYLAKGFDVGHSVVPVTCLRDAPVIFLLVNSTTIYAYNYAIDLLDKIGYIKDYDNISCVSIFEPCFSSFPTHGS